jgi:alkanesulfonate monooxygenase SsuD/methylene tetrahydromethanopterin reductase-like flavin-dependent oxidoreductase (luciferase family)
MKFGTFHLFSVAPWTTPHDVIEDEMNQIVAEDEAGFDVIWLAEHNGRRYGVVGSVLLTVAAAARLTKRARLATAVIRLPLHHPLHLAEDLAYVDVLSGGRVDFGVGKGYDPLEFSTYGVPFEEREERWQDVFASVLHIWETGRTEHAGTFNQGADAELFPGLVQQPVLPIYIMVSRSDSSVVWAAERLYPIHLGQGPDWDNVKHKMELYAETARNAGFGDEAIDNALSNCWQVKQMHLSASTDQAADEYRDGLMWYFQTKTNRVMFGYSPDPVPFEGYRDHHAVLLGSSERIIDQLGRYCEYTGVQNVTCWFNCGSQPQGQVLADVDRFAAEVAPALRDLAVR